MGHRLNNCAFLRLVWPSGWGNCPVCDSRGSPTVNGSLIPRRFARCSGTGLMAPLGEAGQCSRMVLRLCFSLQCNPSQFSSLPPPSLNERWGLIVNDLAIVPSNSFLELQCYWSSICRLRDPVLYCDWGNGPMKSIPTDCHSFSSIGKLCRNPCGLCILVLLVWYFPHNLQKASMSVAICGHQYECQI